MNQDFLSTITDPFRHICSYLRVIDVYHLLRTNKRNNSRDHKLCYLASSKACRAIDAFVDAVGYYPQLDEETIMNFVIAMQKYLSGWHQLIMRKFCSLELRRAYSAMLYRWGSDSYGSKSQDMYDESYKMIFAADEKRTKGLESNIVASDPKPYTLHCIAIGSCAIPVYDRELVFGSYEAPLEIVKHIPSDKDELMYVVIRINGRRCLMPLIALPD